MEDPTEFAAYAPLLSAEAVVALTAQVAALLTSFGFRINPWLEEDNKLPPPTRPCQDVWGQWQGPTVRLEATFTGLLEVGICKLEVTAQYKGLRAASGYFLVRTAAEVQFMLHNWLPLLEERALAASDQVPIKSLSAATLATPLPIDFAAGETSELPPVEPTLEGGPVG